MAANSVVPALPPGFEIVEAPASSADVPLPPGFELVKTEAAKPVSVNSVVRSLATGVPGGGVLNKLNAATNAVLAPVLNPAFDKKDQLSGASFGDRYTESLRQQNKMDKTFAEEHPYIDTAAQLAGGAGALGGVAAASPVVANALGMTGKLVPAMTKGAISGAAIGGADAALRPEADVNSGATVGALTGAGGVVAGKALGKVWDAVAKKWRPAPELQPKNVLDVNGEQVPVRESVLTGDRNVAYAEDAAANGGKGPLAGDIATKYDESTLAAMQRVHDNMAETLAPKPGIRTTPQGAGEAIAREVQSQEAVRAAREAQRLQGLANERDAIASQLSPDGQVVAPTPLRTGELVSQSIQEGAVAAKAARDAAYQSQAQLAGEFSPSVFRRAGNAIRDRLNNAPGDARVRMSEAVTPNGVQALRVIDEDLGKLRFENRVARGSKVIGADGRPEARPITPADVEQTRKQLVILQRQANSASRAPGGSYEDARAVRRVLEEFDKHVERGAKTPGGFSGDSDSYLKGQAAARQSHTDYRKAYSSQGPGDKVGRVIEDIIGKYPGQEMAPDAVVQKLFGSSSAPGGGDTVAIVRRLRDMFGENSPQWASIKQGMLSHLVDTPNGIAPLANDKAADKLLSFFNSTKGASLANTIFSPSEKTRIAVHAQNMRRNIDPAPSTAVGKQIAKWAGRNGDIPASPKTIIDDLMGSTGTKGTSPALVKELEKRVAPETMAAIKQGVWSRITEAAEGKVAWGDQKVGQRIMEFLNGNGKGLADALFTKAEREAMANIGKAHIKMIPIKGTTNPSGSGHTIARAARAGVHTILPFVGFHAGGLPGAMAGFAVDRAAKGVSNRMAAKQAQKLFYGKQASRPGSTGGQGFGALAVQGSTGRRNQSR